MAESAFAVDDDKSSFFLVIFPLLFLVRFFSSGVSAFSGISGKERDRVRGVSMAFFKRMNLL